MYDDTKELRMWFDNVAKACYGVKQLTDFNDEIGFGSYHAYLITGLEKVANRLGLTIHYIPFDSDNHCTEVRVYCNGVQFYDLL